MAKVALSIALRTDTKEQPRRGSHRSTKELEQAILD